MKNNDITVSFGKPVTAPFLVPVKHNTTPTCINDPFLIDGKFYNVTAMSFGNPHGAVFVDDIKTVDVPTLGEALGTHVLFPKGASIVFIQVLDEKSVAVRIWQHGKGEVTFSGEALCVAGTAVFMLQRVLYREVNILIGGNEFIVKWDGCGENVYLTGSAELLKTEE